MLRAEERATNAGLLLEMRLELVKVDAAELGRATDTDEVGAKARALGKARAAAATARTLYFIVEADWLVCWCLCGRLGICNQNRTYMCACRRRNRTGGSFAPAAACSLYWLFPAQIRADAEANAKGEAKAPRLNDGKTTH